ncbi:hypothetical protein GTA08_BOTSDO03279 [Neofusicoccum parvum]|uniref:Uncharacterized protein n=1 Tax=Neofusicoccum parvum TaxID=310453 RepID=A0ACB5RY92_9PEZI|nr:hypothetical protein GTA08_BOTSDO03279 [Neofusicoccum parvum]GME60032.1 hypothetical protein GTA08_BOTSDO03279 [Neofusicoccum parvum]
MRRPRRLTLESVSPRLRPADEGGKRVSGVDQDASGVVDGRDSTRARPSWVKRLSIVSISQSSTRTSASPASPSLSYSNGSMAFSLDGSSAPMISGGAPPPPLPPNKLVKRSTSVRHGAGPEPRPSSSSRPTLRRPATSHQRSKTLGSRPAFMDLPPGRIETFAATGPHQHEPEVRWKQYFSAKGTVAKRRALSGDPKVITRIVPSEKHPPTLVLANAVTAPTLEMEDSSSQAGDSDDARSRPQTPAFADLAPLSPTSISETPAEALASPETGQGEDHARRSFSISDILGTVPLSRKPQHRRRLSADRFVRATRRLSTATTVSTRDGPGAMTNGGEIDELPSRTDASGPLDSPRELHSSYSSHNGDQADVSFESSRPSSSPVFESRTVSLSNTSNHIPSRVPSQHGYTPPSTRPVSHRPASPSSVPIRLSRYSITPSEQASTLVGSDTEARIWSGEESDTDFQSDTVFDSMRTRGTRASSGARGPTIETIFDESPPSLKHKVSPLRDLLPHGTFPELDKHSIIQEEESNFSTPVRSIVPDRGNGNGGSPTPAARTHSRFSPEIPSSPPKPLNLGTLAWDTSADDGDDNRWSFGDDDSDLWEMHSDRTPNMQYATSLALQRSNPILIGTSSSPVSTSTAPRLSTDTYERDARSSIFDWSESAVADKSVGNRTPPRPNTVHGKKDAKSRGSRSVGRRVPSGLHARSQSVPVVPDVGGKRDPMITNKFGTWGVGSKGVTEDWNDDFDFSTCDDGFGGPKSNKPESPSTMFVPKSIREQQTNVLANIGLLREWGLLIEELKDLRGRAAGLNIVEGPYKNMWQEVEAMIDLADQEVDEPLVPQLSPPSSPGFDADAFDEPPNTTPLSGRARGRSILQAARESLSNGASPALSTGNKSRRKSILTSTDDIFSSPSPAPRTPQDTPKATPVGRPRKNSEAVARSVIEALQQRRNTDTLSPNPTTPAKKVPFDTATLKHIVPYVNGLMRQAKGALRETERLYSSPIHTPTHGDSSFHIFAADPPDESPSSRRSRPRSRMTLSEKTFDAKESELVAKTQQMKLMTVM